jgi:hypothetical protein
MVATLFQPPFPCGPAPSSASAGRLCIPVAPPPLGRCRILRSERRWGRESRSNWVLVPLVQSSPEGPNYPGR